MEQYEDYGASGRKKGTQRAFEAALTEPDASLIVPRPLPSETMFMLMLTHLETRINELEEGIKPQKETDRAANHSDSAHTYAR